MAVAIGDGTRYTVHRIPGPELTIADQEQIQLVHTVCFPGEHTPGEPESLPEFFEQATFLHDADCCVWLLLWERADGFNRHLVAMVSVVEYHDSLYAFNFGVLPSHRKRGFGKRLMYGCEVFAAELGLRKMSASVDSSQQRLLSFYLGMGGVVESNGITSAGAPPPTALRLVRHTTREQAAAGIAAADAAILRQRRIRWGPGARPVLAVVAVCVALWRRHKS